MEGLLSQARSSLESYLNPKIIPIEQQLSRDILRGAQGIVFITEIKAGLTVGISGGSGIMLCRNENGNWSGPCAVGIGGISWGFAAGASKVDHIIILPTIHHVRTFMANGSLQIKGNAEACIGDIGRDANVGIGISQNAASSVVSYSFSTKGLYGGVNIEGAIIAVRHSCNEDFYGRPVSVSEIASGNVQIPKQNEDYETIIHLLNNYCQSNSTEINNARSKINNINNNDSNRNSNVNNVTSNLINDQTSIPEVTGPIMQEKPPLIRQNEVSPHSIIEQRNTSKNNNTVLGDKNQI